MQLLRKVQKMKNIFITTISFVLTFYLSTTSANLLIPELKPAQEAFKNSKDVCNGVVNHVQPLAAQGHPQALIAMGDIYKTCSKDSETDKFKNLFEYYGHAAIRDSLSSPKSGSNNKTSGRSWAYHRLWGIMHYGNEVTGYDPLNYVREMHTLAAAALYHGGRDLCWRAGGLWLESKYGCDAITQLANDYVYPKGPDGWKSPLKNNPLKGTMLQIHLANESNLNQEEVNWVFEFAKVAFAGSDKFSGKIICNNSTNFSGGIQALRQSLVNSPFYGHCRYNDWSAAGKTLTAKSFNDYGLVVQFSGSAGWGLIDLPGLQKMALEAANELGVDIRDIATMDKFVDDLHTRIFEPGKIN